MCLSTNKSEPLLQDAHLFHYQTTRLQGLPQGYEAAGTDRVSAHMQHCSGSHVYSIPKSVEPCRGHALYMFVERLDIHMHCNSCTATS